MYLLLSKSGQGECTLMGEISVRLLSRLLGCYDQTHPDHEQQSNPPCQSKESVRRHVCTFYVYASAPFSLSPLLPGMRQFRKIHPDGVHTRVRTPQIRGVGPALHKIPA